MPNTFAPLSTGRRPVDPSAQASTFLSQPHLAATDGLVGGMRVTRNGEVIGSEESSHVGVEQRVGLVGRGEIKALKARAVEKANPIWHWHAVLGFLLASSSLVVLICILALNSTVSAVTYTSFEHMGVNARNWNMLLAVSIGLLLVGAGYLFARIMIFWRPIALSIHLSYVNGFRWILALVRDNFVALLLGTMSGIHNWFILIPLIGLRTDSIGFFHANEQDNAEFHRDAKHNDRFANPEVYQAVEGGSKGEPLEKVRPAYYLNYLKALVSLSFYWVTLGFYWGDKLVALDHSSVYFIVLTFSGLVALSIDVVTAILILIRYLRTHETAAAYLRKKNRFEIIYSALVTARDLAILWAVFSLAILDPMIV